MISAIRDKYERRYDDAINSVIAVCLAVRDQKNASIDQKIRAIQLCIEHLPEVMRGLIFVKNTDGLQQAPVAQKTL